MQAPDALERTDEPDSLVTPESARHRTPSRAMLISAAAALAVSLAIFGVDVWAHQKLMLTWYDLKIYLISGMHVRTNSSILYSWKLATAVKFVYTPLAAVLFAGVSYLPLRLVEYLMTMASMAAVIATVWLILRGLGLQGRVRTVTWLAASAALIWIWPVIWSLHLGQVEPLLMVLIVWDLTQPDSRRWKGAGVGLAAGIKLVPLIYIPYLLLARKFRQAVVAAGVFAVTIIIGFIALPAQSRLWWLTGYLFKTKKNGSVESLVNQSLFGMLARAAGGPAPAHTLWFVLAGLIALAGVTAAAILHRTGRPVQGMVLCSITALLASPISWDNHWVWIVPLLAMLAGLIVQATGRARVALLAAGVVVFTAFAAWPTHFAGTLAFVPQRSFLGWFAKTGPVTFRDVSTLHGTQLITWNLYVLAGLVIVAVMVAPTWRAWRVLLPQRRAVPPTPAS